MSKTIWISFFPVKGEPLLRDARVITNVRNCYPFGKDIITYINGQSVSQTDATTFVERLRGKLSKRYRVYIYTDAQKCKRYQSENWLSPILSEFLTKTQIKNSILIQ